MARTARTAASLIMASLCLALAPAAQATHINRWQDGGAEAPSSTSLDDVAAHEASGVVVVVGEDATSGQAVILRRAGETWVEDQISLPGAVGSDLEAVAVGQSAAVTVGSYQDAGGSTNALVLRVTGGESALTSAAAATWSPAAGALPTGTEPRAVALRGSEGLIGTGDKGAYPRGAVYRYDDATGIGAALTPSPPAPPAGPVNSISFYADGKAFAGAELPSDDPADPGDGGTSRIFRIDLLAPGGPQMLPAAMAPVSEDPMLPIAGIAADSEDDAIAIEGNPEGNEDPDTWSQTGAVWSRDDNGDDFTTGSRPRDVSADGSGSSFAVIVGTYNGLPAVWWGGNIGYWVVNTPPADGALNGVIVLESDDMWAVGENGTVIHYAPAPDPPPPDTTIVSGPVGETTATTATFGFSSPESGATFKCSIDGAPFTDCNSPKTYSGLALGQHTFQVRAIGVGGEDPTPAERIFTVVPQQSGSGGSGGGSGSSGVPVVQPTNGQCKSAPRPLLSNVVVRKRPGYLEIEFDAAADVRVQAKAYHGTDLIGRTSQRVLKQGHHVLKLRYGAKKGKPTRLKLLASPAASDACP